MKIKSVIKSLLYGEREIQNFWRKYYYIKEHNNILQKKYKIDIKKIQDKYNCGIPLEANIENKPILPHKLNGIFISKGAKIGKNCVIFHQVTIGSANSNGSKNNGSPTIGDNCYIGAGAKIIGNIKIGDNVRIGANCCVFTDIPDNATVVCEKSRIIVHDEKRNNTFYEYGDKA